MQGCYYSAQGIVVCPQKNIREDFIGCDVAGNPNSCTWCGDIHYEYSRTRHQDSVTEDKVERVRTGTRPVKRKVGTEKVKTGTRIVGTGTGTIVGNNIQSSPSGTTQEDIYEDRDIFEDGVEDVYEDRHTAVATPGYDYTLLKDFNPTNFSKCTNPTLPPGCLLRGQPYVDPVTKHTTLDIACPRNPASLIKELKVNKIPITKCIGEIREGTPKGYIECEGMSPEDKKVNEFTDAVAGSSGTFGSDAGIFAGVTFTFTRL